MGRMFSGSKCALGTLLGLDINTVKHIGQQLRKHNLDKGVWRFLSNLQVTCYQ